MPPGPPPPPPNGPPGNAWPQQPPPGWPPGGTGGAAAQPPDQAARQWGGGGGGAQLPQQLSYPPQPPQPAQPPQQTRPPAQPPGWGGQQGTAAWPGYDPRWTGAQPSADPPVWASPGERGAPTVEDLTAQSLIRQRKRTPQTGWRKALYTLSAHAVNPGEAPSDLRRRELMERATVPVRGCYRIAVISLKGGVGKTTMTVCLGATLASLRGDRVIAVDANPDRGTLSGKLPLETVATVRNLLNDADRIGRYSDVRRYTSQSPDRLEVLASESDPAVSIAFSEGDYRVVAGILERFYNVVLTDCGTGLLHSAMSGVLALANQLVVVSSGSVDGARSASATLDWLEAHGHRSLVAGSVAVINSVRPKSGGVDLDRLHEHFAARCRSVVQVPYDPHLEEGAEVDLSALRAETRYALLELAAYTADGFPRDGGPAARPMAEQHRQQPQLP
ncbi:MAG TPA: MinD/ParA family protein [Mycobacteriales bacterium]|nr:MinD/ParA family protein [Mycobacteriales bacterium]